MKSLSGHYFGFRASLCGMLLSSLLATAQPGAAAVSVEESAQGKIIRAMRFVGLKRTHEYVARREFAFKEGDPLDMAALTEGLQRLRNIQLFDRATSDMRVVDGEVELIITLEERWTTLPILRFITSGGSTSYIFGLFDINSFGRYLELGGQYENLNGSHSGVVWFREPRFLNQYLRVGGDFWLVMRNRDLYTDSGMLQGGFTMQRKRAHLFADKELHRYFILGMGLDFHADEISEDELDAARKSLNAANGLNVTGESQNLFWQAYAQFGRLDYDTFKVKGYQSLIEYDQSAEFWGSDDNIARLHITNQAFWILPWQSNVGAQFRLGMTDTDTLQYQFYLGGFDTIRGYNDGKFRGGAYWQGNLEYRVPSWQSRYLVLQHVVFTDLTQNATDLQTLAEFNNELFATLGTGIRLLSPKIYRFNLRLDLAYPLNFDEGLTLSFATQQFF